nr:hypothetical protein [Tanacetum cinerariifolium]
ESRIGDSDWTTRSWTSSVLLLLVGCIVSLVSSVLRSTTREVVGIVGPGYAIPLRVVIPFRSSFGLAEEYEVDEPELGISELDKLVFGKMEVGFDLAFSAAISVSEEVIELDDSLRWAEVSQSLW